MLSNNPLVRRHGGDYFIKSMRHNHRLHLPPLTKVTIHPKIPIWSSHLNKEIETVCYSSRKSFMRQHANSTPIHQIDDVQLDKYYRNFMVGMADTEKGFIAAVSRLGQYPIVGGLAIHWRESGIYIDSNLALYDNRLKQSLTVAVNNMVTLAQGIKLKGVFKACFFNAKNTLHFSHNAQQQLQQENQQQLVFDVGVGPILENKSRLHSYFEDGRDPDESLELPKSIMKALAKLNQIHHTGCIIFEKQANHLKIHHYLKLLNPRKQAEFRANLDLILSCTPEISGSGISGFMKLPYKNTRQFNPIEQLPSKFYPRNPKAI